MTMQFTTSFHCMRDAGPIPSLWQELFENPKKIRWDEEGGGGTAQFISATSRYTVEIYHNRDLGFLLAYRDRDLVEQRNRISLYSVGAEAELGVFDEFVADEFLHPKGSFLEASDAWKAFAEFLKTPKKPPSAIQWIAESKLDWPGHS